MRKLPRTLLAALVAMMLLHSIVAITLSEGILHLSHKVLTPRTCALAESGSRQVHANMADVRITSFDGVGLAAWSFRPEQGNGASVILLHGHGDNRAGMLGFVPMLLRHHYAVLVPDARAHGESGGEIATFGLDEARDLSRWVDWLAAQNLGGCIYGLGESMGAAMVLQALPTEPRFCAVVAESPFASFREVAYDRLGQKLGMSDWARRPLFLPLITEAFLYVKWRYGIDLDHDSPAESVSSTRVPILLIHGTEDFNIPVRHCEEILAHRSGVMEFWQVPGAGHTGAFGREPEEFEHRVTAWFSRHPQK
jgi:uncharacterized protein